MFTHDKWPTSNADISLFNADISKWVTSKVTSMYGMFQGNNFNNDISKFDVSQVVDMRQMFTDNTAFNNDITGWDVSRATRMQSMFVRATSFNQDLSKWNIEKLSTAPGQGLGGMFASAAAFNFKLALDASWENKNPDVYPGNNMFWRTCSLDAACGKCGKKDTANNPVTCSISSLTGTDVNTVCTFCANDGYEW